MATNLDNKLFIAGFIAYSIGAVPFGWLIARTKGVNILSHGSGKIGYTNIHRVLGPRYAVPVLALDILKGMISVLIAKFLLPSILPGIGETFTVLVAMIGHSFSPILWLVAGRFGGGRSLATALGATLLISPTAALVGLFANLLVVVFTRYASLGGIVGIFCVATAIAIDVRLEKLDATYAIYAIIVPAFLFWRHAESIHRLMLGTERKISK